MDSLVDSVIFGDCLEVMKTIPDGSIDLVLSDLPYEVTQNKKDVKLDLRALWIQYKRVAKPNAAFVLTAQFPFSFDLYESNKKDFRYDLIWDKVLPSGHLNANRMPLRSHEHVLVFYRRQPTYNPQFTEGSPLHAEGKGSLGKDVVHQNYGKWNRLDDRRKGSTQKHSRSILRFPKPHASSALHPTQKSLDLFEWLVQTYSNEGDLVLDNCCGSGTTAVACKKMNRRFIAIDDDPRCIEITRQRLSELRAVLV